MRTKFIIAIAFFAGLSTLVNAQTLGDFSPKEERGAYGPRKFPSKDVYIADFAVHYQVYSDRSTTNKGNQMLVKGVMGKAKATLTVGLDIPEATLQQITDEAYAKFVADLKAQGFNVLPADAAGNTDYYKGYTRYDNLGVIASGSMPGGVTVHPRNVPFYSKSEGLFQSYAKLSSELNDANIIRVDLHVLFLDTQASNKGFGAKVSAETNLCLAAYENVTSIETNDSFTTKIGITGKTRQATANSKSVFTVVTGRNKIGGSPLGTYTGILKKNLEIKDVLKDQKLKSVASSDYDNLGTETAFGKLYTARNTKTTNVATVTVDADKYEKGVESAITKFLDYHVNEFKTKFF